MILLLGGCGVRATTTSPTQQPVPATAVADHANTTTDPVPTEPSVPETVVDNDPTKTISPPPTELEDMHSVIIDADIVELDSVQFYISNFESLWTPTQNNILQLEAGLAAYLQQNAEPEQERIWQELADYKRQYVGITQDGQEKIYANFFCEGDNSDTMLVFVLDGGDCYFQVLYTVENDQFSYLSVNGEA